MNHNPHNIQLGDTVILDINYINSSMVTVAEISPRGVHARVYSADIKTPHISDIWEVMTNRLTPKKS
jgi:hypothetical protein